MAIVRLRKTRHVDVRDLEAAIAMAGREQQSTRIAPPCLTRDSCAYSRQAAAG